ncbi:precorrin-3B C(17)-methyltransferase [Alphaproteobacteria bacterium HT1-32]|nr:precorrin-3B C(17)-methyltransferase [Alphaproteobacteria bacterium HT1-32]
MSEAPVLVVLTASGAELARRIQARFPGCEIHGLASRVENCDRRFERTMEHIAGLFQAGRPVIGICAAGILIRAVAGLLADKQSEPPVLALSPDGGSVVPLLGGHKGANRLAQELAAVTGGVAAVTTAGDVLHGVSLDDPPAGWKIARPEAAKPVMADLLAGKPLSLCGDGGAWLAPLKLASADAASARIHVTTRSVDPLPEQSLVLHPPRLVIGVGCERDCAPEELTGLVRSTLERHGLAAASVAAVVSVDLKSDEPAVHAVAESLAVPARFFDPARLEQETPRLVNPSDIVFSEVGCHGVSEGAALAAVGASGQLVVPKTKSARATCAIAEATGDLDPLNLGVGRGHLAVIGVGPGSADWRTAEATALLTGAEDVVGYGFYLDLVADLIADKPRHQTDLGAEEERARRAIELAATGRRVALVCSGDAGIYALATLVWELLDQGQDAAWRRIEVTVAPGVSALQAAAARAGAPIGHDFCAISLSDLLTPRETILQRLQAAVDGDFVTALYNPRSQRRTELIERAIELYRAGRPATTPVVIARSLGRPDEAVRIVELQHLDPADIDMMTILLIGASRTTTLEHGGKLHAYTPRGYLS